jgi:hypothetical protein
MAMAHPLLYVCMKEIKDHKEGRKKAVMGVSILVSMVVLAAQL